jgi:hypothetical protein
LKIGARAPTWARARRAAASKRTGGKQGLRELGGGVEELEALSRGHLGKAEALADLAGKARHQLLVF